MRKNIKPKTKIFLKIFLCTIYIFIIIALLIASIKIYKNKVKINSWEEATSGEEYTYMYINKMSEKFATYDTSKKTLHFVKTLNKDGSWHIYIIAINDSDYNKYKDIIDYTYGRTNKKPKDIKIYGYPVQIKKEVKNLGLMISGGTKLTRKCFLIRFGLTECFCTPQRQIKSRNLSYLQRCRLI